MLRRTGIWVFVMVVMVWSPIAARAQAPAPQEVAPAPPAGSSSWTPVTPTVQPAQPVAPPPPGQMPYPPAGAPWPYPPGGVMPAPGAAWGAQRAAPYGRRQVYVQLRTDDARTRIDRVVANTTVPVCFAPCMTMLDADSLYVIQGDGVRSTARFLLPDDRDSVFLDVHAGSTVRLGVGAAMIAVGLAVAYGGLVAVQAGELQNASLSQQDGDRTVRFGATLLAASLPISIIGIYLVAATHTTVISSTGSTFTRETPSTPSPRRRVALTPRGLEF